MTQPNPKKHQEISFIKSAIRIIGYFTLLFNIPLGVAILITSEVIGIYEELV